MGTGFHQLNYLYVSLGQPKRQTNAVLEEKAQSRLD